MFCYIDMICNHTICIDDERTGDTVCIECGRVMSERNIIQASTQERAPPQERGMETIKDLCASHHMPDGLALLACDIYARYRRSNRALDGYIAFSIYRACVEHRCPRSVTEIALICRVSPKNLWKIIRDTWQEHCIQMKPSDFSSRVYPQIDDLYRLYSKYVRHCAVADVMSLGSAVSPNLVLAAVLTTYLPKRRNGALEKGRIADACAVAASSVQKCMRQSNYGQLLGYAEKRVPSPLLRADVDTME